MFTTCPKCALNLALNVADLRLGQGYVRCGRCANVFNALPSLTDEGDADDSASATATRPAVDLDAMREHDAGVASIEVMDSEPAIEAPIESQAEPVDAEPTQTTVEPAEATGEHEVLRTGTFETIVLEGDAITQTEETVAESEVDAQLQALVQRFDAVREADADAGAQIDALWPPAAQGSDADLDLSDEPDFDLDADDDDLRDEETISPAVAASLAAAAESSHADADLPPEPVPTGEALLEESGDDASGSQRRIWIAGAVALALLLVGQVVHHFREDLVSRSWAAGPLTSLYRVFHVQLEPRWDLSAYEVRQLGADAVPGATPQIAVRASIRNRAPRAQPPPLLRVVLQDRFGKQLATREILPADYLRGNAPPRLGADQRVDANLTLPDPGQNAVGFEIDACLRGARGVLRCASDPPAP